MRTMKSYLFLFVFTLLQLASATTGATTVPSSSTSPLQEFHTKFFYGLFISTDEALFNETYNNGYSPDLVEKYINSGPQHNVDWNTL